ncbi:hypothetical protein ACFQ0M_25420 [Kitasatospora aburaviensis]
MVGGGARGGCGGGPGEAARVGRGAGQRGGRHPRQLLGEVDDFERSMGGEGRDPGGEDGLPVRADPGQCGAAEVGGQGPSGGPVRGAVLVEQQPAVGEFGGGAAGGAGGGAVQRDAGERLAVGVGAVHQDGPAEPDHRAVAGGAEQREQDGVAAQVDPAVPAPGGPGGGGR